MAARIVVTGLGCISGAGKNVGEFNRSIFSDGPNKSILPISLFSPDKHMTKIAAEVKNYAPGDFFSAAELKQYDRFSQFALLSADEAITDAGLAFDDNLSKRTCVVHGTSIGGQETIENAYRQFYREGQKRPHPYTVPKLLPSAAGSFISMKYGIKGPAFATASACASSGHAIAMAVLMLRSNMAEVAIAGGAEACITKGNFQAWEGLRVLSPDSCRPFSAKRSGLVIGEGGATLVLETLDHALAREASIYAELTGIGMSSDAHNIVQPLAEGAEMAMQAALADAGIHGEDIQYINAHGSGTVQNDRVETRAIHNVFGGHAGSLKISSTKSVHGHVLGAGGALESIAAILALKQQRIPATKNYLAPDSECDLDYVPNVSCQAEIGQVMSNSFAFGGLNTSLIFKRFT
ncbi:beta-ketoacyl-[acyl-carrier-protein] synthase family protein [Thalassomonas actiniarum]|uniref:Nodulation protein E n=1 Tax=Thalassomonas actiniarum TaxID=485447 RepID=A0AAE9YSA1_9GAMM|nr:beta-ketoacyl-[acyl-carrier-protein] synthase family protein [Thalassomonas actiniarum]WDD99378.1 beta-ketoacyl-[acyl-carrier-protein] synthase family protein [Thalassomonas actiniarum]